MHLPFNSTTYFKKFNIPNLRETIELNIKKNFLDRKFVEDKYLKSVNFYILPGKPGKKFKNIHLYNQTYQFFKTFWETTLRELNSKKIFYPADEFKRQDAIAIITKGDKILALLCLNYFKTNIVSTFEHSYFADYPNEVLKFLNQNKIINIMSQQFYCIPKEFRHQKDKNWAAVLAGLSLKIADSWGCMAINIAREDVATKYVVEKFGYKKIGPTFYLHNVPCSIMGCLKPGKYHREEVNLTIEYLWDKRIDLTFKENKNVFKRTI